MAEPPTYNVDEVELVVAERNVMEAKVEFKLLNAPSIRVSLIVRLDRV